MTLRVYRTRAQPPRAHPAERTLRTPIPSRPHHDGPASSILRYWLGRLGVACFGWRVAGRVPPGRKFVLIGAPHTSNWDAYFMITAMGVQRLRFSWLAKAELFRWPYVGLLRRLGAIPVVRDAKHGTVPQMVERFRTEERFTLVVGVSGTRRKSEAWRSGFYWIAVRAQAPIICAYLDYARREAGLGLCFQPTGNVRADMDRIRAFYADIRGKYPDQETPPRLREEDLPA